MAPMWTEWLENVRAEREQRRVDREQEATQRKVAEELRRLPMVLAKPGPDDWQSQDEAAAVEA